MFRPDLGVKSSLSAPDIGLGRVDNLAALEDLPETVEEEKDWHTNVGSEEAGEFGGAPVFLGELKVNVSICSCAYRVSR